jgi:hypothetical protein
VNSRHYVVRSQNLLQQAEDNGVSDLNGSPFTENIRCSNQSMRRCMLCHRALLVSADLSLAFPAGRSSASHAGIYKSLNSSHPNFSLPTPFLSLSALLRLSTCRASNVFVDWQPRQTRCARRSSAHRRAQLAGFQLLAMRRAATRPFQGQRRPGC